MGPGKIGTDVDRCVRRRFPTVSTPQTSRRLMGGPGLAYGNRGAGVLLRLLHTDLQCLGQRCRDQVSADGGTRILGLVVVSQEHPKTSEDLIYDGKTRLSDDLAWAALAIAASRLRFPQWVVHIEVPESAMKVKPSRHDAVCQYRPFQCAEQRGASCARIAARRHPSAAAPALTARRPLDIFPIKASQLMIADSGR